MAECETGEYADLNGKHAFISIENRRIGGMEREICECCETCAMHKERSEKEYRDLMNRLKRIEGQVRGLQGMLERDAYCMDIMVQVYAVNAALNSFNKVLLANHLETCVKENIRKGNDVVIEELVQALPKLMK